MKNKKIKIVCNICNNEIIVSEKDIKKFYNWKCEKCYNIIMLKDMAYVKWNCSRPDTPRRHPQKK